MCFSLAWLGQLLVYLVIIGAVFAIIRLLVPWVLSQLGAAGGIIAQVLNIVLWAILAIIVIWVVIDLLSCLSGTGGFSLAPPRPR